MVMERTLNKEEKEVIKKLITFAIGIKPKEHYFRPAINISEENLKLMIRVAQIAGFDVDDIKVGELSKMTPSKSGWASDATDTQINSFTDRCLLKTIDGRKVTDWFASGWINAVMHNVWFGKAMEESMAKTHKDLLGKERDSDYNLEDEEFKFICKEIKRCVLPKPIPLTQDGDIMLIYDTDTSDGFWVRDWFLFDHVNDETNLPKYPGKHKECGGGFEIKNGAKGLNVLLCNECHLRLTFPETIKTYGELRKFFGRKIK